jgi:hypothetical protein
VLGAVVDMEVAVDTIVDSSVVTVLAETSTDVASVNGPELGNDCADDTALDVPVLSQLLEVLLEPVCTADELLLLTEGVLMAFDGGTVEPVWIEAEDDPVVTGSTDTVEVSVGPAEGAVVVEAETLI